MRVVLDTNQFVSALISKYGASAKVLQAFRDGQIEVAISPLLLAEVNEVLHRPRLKRKYHLTDRDIEAYLLLLSRYAIMVPGKVEVDVVAADPDDNLIISCALEAEADYIVSGDHHLLDLGEYQGIQIIRALELLQMLAETEKADEKD